MSGSTQQELTLVYEQTIGRDPTAAELALGQQQLADGDSLLSIRTYLAATGDAATALSALTEDVVERGITSSELTTDQTYLASGGSLSALRSYFSITAEATDKLQVLYENELDRAITAPELAADEQLIASGSSLAAIDGYLSVSNEAARDVTELLDSAYYPGPDAVPNISTANPPFEPFSSALGAAELGLAAGASLGNAIAETPLAQDTIINDYQTLLGIAPSAATVTAATQQITQLLQQVPVQETGVNTFSPVFALAASSPTIAAGVNGSYQAAIGRPANAVELAAAHSNFNLFTLPELEQQVAELSGGPVGISTYVPGLIGGGGSAQPLAGTSDYVVGLLHDDALITPSAMEYVSDNLSGLGTSLLGTLLLGASAAGAFNAATDIIQIETPQAANFSALTLTQVNPASGGSYTNIAFGHGLDIDVYTPASTLTAANFRFV